MITSTIWQPAALQPLTEIRKLWLPGNKKHLSETLTVANKPEILKANEKVDIHENSLLNSCLYPNFANSASSAVKYTPLGVSSSPIFFSSRFVGDPDCLRCSGNSAMIFELCDQFFNQLTGLKQNESPEGGDEISFHRKRGRKKLLFASCVGYQFDWRGYLTR